MTAALAVDNTFLNPGDVAIAERGQRLQTLLGSCVAVVATDPRRTVGAMCHIVLAHTPVGHDETSGAHGQAALDRMAALLLERGIVLRLCEAWVYGGGNLFALPPGARSVGADNARWVQQALQALGVRVLAVDVGGQHARRLSWTVGVSAPQVDKVPA